VTAQQNIADNLRPNDILLVIAYRKTGRIEIAAYQLAPVDNSLYEIALDRTETTLIHDVTLTPTHRADALTRIIKCPGDRVAGSEGRRGRGLRVLRDSWLSREAWGAGAMQEAGRELAAADGEQQVLGGAGQRFAGSQGPVHVRRPQFDPG
jgi:hypothetical protein